MRTAMNNTLFMTIFAVLCILFSCSKKQVKVHSEFSSPDKLITALETANNGTNWATIVEHIDPADRSTFVVSILVPLKMFAVMSSIIQGGLSGLGKGMLNAFSGKEDSSTEDKKKIAETQIEESVNKTMKPYAKFRKDLDTIIKKYGVDEKLFDLDLNTKFDSFQDSEDTFKKYLKNVDVVAMLGEIHKLVVQLEEKDRLRFNHNFGEIDRSTLSINNDVATVKTKDLNGQLTLKRIGDRWYFSLRDSNLDEKQSDSAAQKQDSKEQALEEKRAQDRKKLKNIATGVWENDLITVKFNQDGTAVVKGKSGCLEIKDDLTKVFIDKECTQASSEGTLEIENYQYGIKEETSSSIYAAYVDANNSLHLTTLTSTDTVPLIAGRYGMIELDMFRKIEVSDTCSLLNEMNPNPVPIKCSFEKKGDKTFFFYEVPDQFEENKMVKKAMVYLEKENLLVCPMLHFAVLKKIK